MIKRIVSAGIFILCLACSSCTALAYGDADKGGETGQMEVVYVPDNRPALEIICKGEGKLMPGPRTGDTGILLYLERLVIASAALLMLIIIIKKGENKYEEDEIYERIGIGCYDQHNNNSTGIGSRNCGGKDASYIYREFCSTGPGGLDGFLPEQGDPD